jgi:hypothetical protein
MVMYEGALRERLAYRPPSRRLQPGQPSALADEDHSGAYPKARVYQAEMACGNVMAVTGGEPGCSMAYPGSGRVGVCLAKQGLPRYSGCGSRYPYL